MDENLQCLILDLPPELIETILENVGFWERRTLTLTSSETSFNSGILYTPKNQKPAALFTRQVPGLTGNPASSRKHSPKPPLSRSLVSSISLPMFYRVWAEPTCLRLRLVCTTWRNLLDDSLLKNPKALDLSEVLSAPSLSVPFDVLVKSVEDRLFKWSLVRRLSILLFPHSFAVTGAPLISLGRLVRINAPTAQGSPCCLPSPRSALLDALQPGCWGRLFHSGLRFGLLALSHSYHVVGHQEASCT